MNAWLGSPDLKRDVFGDLVKVGVRGPNSQFVTDAKVGQQGVDCPGLDTMLAAQIAKLSGGNMIVPVGIEERKRHEARDDLLPGFGS